MKKMVCYCDCCKKEVDLGSEISLGKYLDFHPACFGMIEKVARRHEKTTMDIASRIGFASCTCINDIERTVKP